MLFAQSFLGAVLLLLAVQLSPGNYLPNRTLRLVVQLIGTMSGIVGPGLLAASLVAESGITHDPKSLDTLASFTFALVAFAARYFVLLKYWEPLDREISAD